MGADFNALLAEATADGADDYGPWRQQWLGHIADFELHIDPLLEGCEPSWIKISTDVFLVAPSVARWLTRCCEQLDIFDGDQY